MFDSQNIILETLLHSDASISLLKTVFQGRVVRNGVWFLLSSVPVFLGVDELYPLWMVFFQICVMLVTYTRTPTISSTVKAVWEVFKDIKDLLQ